MTDSPPREPWHLDRRVPVALIVTLVIQTGAVVWWASNIDKRVEQLEDQVATRALVNERLARMEAQIGGIRENTARIESWLRRISDRADKP